MRELQDVQNYNKKYFHVQCPVGKTFQDRFKSEI